MNKPRGDLNPLAWLLHLFRIIWLSFTHVSVMLVLLMLSQKIPQLLQSVGLWIPKTLWRMWSYPCWASRSMCIQQYLDFNDSHFCSIFSANDMWQGSHNVCTSATCCFWGQGEAHKLQNWMLPMALEVNHHTNNNQICYLNYPPYEHIKKFCGFEDNIGCFYNCQWNPTWRTHIFSSIFLLSFILTCNVYTRTHPPWQK